jgi:hypothetical protein
MNSREFEVIFLALQQTPEKVRALTTGVSAKDLCLKNFQEEFSILEHVCHLRDIEVEGYVPRVRRILSEENPALPDIDGGKLAMERDYNRENLASALQVFSQARDANLQLLQSVSENQLNREGDLEGTGTIKLWQLLNLQREHDEEHLRELGILCHQRSAHTDE